ncbi:hypothetical protein V6R21_21515 [Limibacter armeniacum]|uniref:hypothetical protein n=1 Tax=Limibacter armeniacum TaxID=466084 RepID=UPI002FE5F4E3
MLKRTFLWILLLFPVSVLAQEQELEEGLPKVSFGGYLKYLQNITFQEVQEEWTTDNLIHNRLNFKWYATDELTAVVEMRNRIFYGEGVKDIPNYQMLVTENDYWLDMDATYLVGESVFAYSILDRAYLDWTHGTWQLRVGRQRINWGKTMVWNPNDIFNTYTFFDFDYEERPGVDGILVRKYTGMLSSVEFAIALQDSFDEMTMAGMYRFNKWAYDFQVLAGKMKKDWVMGAGWSGQIGGAGFKGEASYFYPMKDADKNPALVASTGVDYTFPNSFYIGGEVILNTDGATDFLPDFSLLEPLTPRTLTFNKWSVFAQVSYPLTPLVTVSGSSIFNLNDNSFYLGGSTDISLTDNLYLLLVVQSFEGDVGSQFGEAGLLLFWRLKWSF